MSRKLWVFRIHLQTTEQQSSAVHTLPYILASDLHKRHFSETFKYVIPAVSKWEINWQQTWLIPEIAGNNLQ